MPPVSVAPVARQQFLDASGRPLAGGFIYTTVSGGSTPLATYVDYTGLTLASNPIQLDSGGFAQIWLASGQVYRFKVTDSAGSQQWVVDGIVGSPNLLAPGPIGTSVPDVVEATYFLTSSNLPALGGVVRLGSTDTICWRNNANSGDLCLSKDVADILEWPTGFQVSGNSYLNGGISTNNQIISTLPTGTPPFVVASTTLVPNLNANLLNGNTFPNPGPIGATMPAAGTFSSLQSSSATPSGSFLTLGHGDSIVWGNAAGSGTVGLEENNANDYLQWDGNVLPTFSGAVTAGHAVTIANGGQIQDAGLPAPLLVASGTATLIAGVVTAPTCQAPVTVAAAGALSTDTIAWAYASAPTSDDGLMIVHAYVTTGAVHFLRCNASGQSETGTALVINWRVLR